MLTMIRQDIPTFVLLCVYFIFLFGTLAYSIFKELREK